MIIRALLHPIVLLPVLAAMLFFPAGDVAWPMGWAVLAVYLSGMCAFNLLVIVRNPDLARERARPPAGTKKWDRTLTNLTNLPILLILPLAGFDRRWGWSQTVNCTAQVAALLAFGLALALIGWAMMSNPFFSALVRIQAERGHAVASGGPYRLIRHPGYLGMLALPPAAALALGSLWGLACGVVAGSLYVVRTALEDRTLMEELPGYREYASKVRHRLVPGVW